MSMSKLEQQADKRIPVDQEKICTQKARDWKDLIIVQEKIDGSNVGVFMDEKKEIHAITRSGYSALTSPFKQHHYFHNWVEKNQKRFLDILNPGERICGEWILQTHSIKYNLIHEPFVVFDIFNAKNKRILYLDFIKKTKGNFVLANLIHIGQPISIKNSIKILSHGKHGSIDIPEGVVYRIEREERVDFLCKYVRSDKIDGLYMKDEIFNKNWEVYI